jgi:hypothetical protein
MSYIFSSSAGAVILAFFVGVVIVWTKSRGAESSWAVSAVGAVPAAPTRVVISLSVSSLSNRSVMGDLLVQRSSGPICPVAVAQGRYDQAGPFSVLAHQDGTFRCGACQLGVPVPSQRAECMAECVVSGNMALLDCPEPPGSTVAWSLSQTPPSVWISGAEITAVGGTACAGLTCVNSSMCRYAVFSTRSFLNVTGNATITIREIDRYSNQIIGEWNCLG